MNISDRIEQSLIEIKQVVECHFDNKIKVDATRGFMEDERADKKVGLSIQPTISSITSYGGSASVINEVLFTCYLTIGKNTHNGQLARLKSATDIFAYFGGRYRYENFIILDCYDFTTDYITDGIGEVYKFTLHANLSR